MTAVKFPHFVLILFALSFSACDKTELAVHVPGCIENKIKEIESNSVTNPPAEIWQWRVGIKTYYYFEADCCDQYNYLYDDNCQIICAPDGGLAGNGDGNCDGLGADVQKTLIWPKDGSHD
jgi:hypothetical protein